MTQRQAARTYGIPQGTLSKRLEWLNQGNREDRIREAEEQILDHTIAAAEAAQRELAKRVTEDPAALTVKELVPIAGFSQDKLAVRRNWGKGGAGEGASAGVLADVLQKLAAGGRVTITGPREGDQAIDVTPGKGETSE